jgi:serine protease Do
MPRLPRILGTIGLLTLLAIMSSAMAPASAAQTSYAGVVAAVQPKMVKIYGAGGLSGLEAYQSGFLVSAEGHILTVWSYVLDAEVITVMLDDGRRFEAQVIGMDPRLEIAVLKIDATDLPHFNLDAAVALTPGQRVLAFSNMFGVATGDEPTSVLHGTVSARTELAARRGAFETNYHGQVYVLDAMTNNPGAAGGALTNNSGQLAGLLGKELRSSLSNMWLNYAIPIGELSGEFEDIRAGRQRPAARAEDEKKPREAHQLALLGINLVPDFLQKTPPFIESVRPNSPAAKAGLRPDDLILFVNGRIVSSCKLLTDELSYIDRFEALQLTIQRGQELIEVSLTAN